jgi:NAD(P)-dependent dehydrogenase (short-subunit alcohol dehydrogenase family)
VELQTSTVLVTGATDNMGPYVTDVLVDRGADIVGPYVTDGSREQGPESRGTGDSLRMHK